MSEKLSNKKIRVNAFDPGQVLGTGFLRTFPAPIRFIANNLMPFFVKKNNSPKTSGARLANLAYAKELHHLSGIYYSDGKVTKSSNDSYNKNFQEDLWRSSIELIGIPQQDTTIILL